MDIEMCFIASLKFYFILGGLKIFIKQDGDGKQWVFVCLSEV